MGELLFVKAINERTRLISSQMSPPSLPNKLTNLGILVNIMEMRRMNGNQI